MCVGEAERDAVGSGVGVGVGGGGGGSGGKTAAPETRGWGYW